jgi:hypothetical protein
VFFGEFRIGDERFPGFRDGLELHEEFDWKSRENFSDDLEWKSGE